MVEERQVHKLTGIEGWFDAPAPTAGPGGTDTAAPPRWKQAVSIWLGFFPVNLVFTLLVSAAVPLWDELWAPLRVLLTTVVLTPVMVYWVLPVVTRMLHPWLARGR